MNLGVISGWILSGEPAPRGEEDFVRFTSIQGILSGGLRLGYHDRLVAKTGLQWFH